MVTPDLIRRSITSFMADTIRPTVETDKVYWNAKIRRNHLYYEGKQNLSYAPIGSGLVDYQPVRNGNMQLSTGAGDTTLYDYVLNVLQGDVDTYTAVLGSKSPNGQAQARDLSNEMHVRLKQKADRVNAWLDSHWNVDMLHPEVVKGIALYGTMFSYTRYTTNKRKYGETPVTQYDVQHVPAGPAYYQCRFCGTETIAEQAHAMAAQDPSLPMGAATCSKCGSLLGPELLVQPDTIPSLVPTSVIPYANGAVEISILNGAYVTSPLWVKELENAGWHIYETEEDKGALIHAYEELRPKAYDDWYYIDKSSASAAGRWTRELLISPTGYQVPRTKARWLHTRLWIAPTSYEYLPNDKSGELRDFFYGAYPEGIMLPMVNGEPLVGDLSKGIQPRIKGERITSVWAACKPKPSGMLYSEPYFECMIQMTDTVNDSINMVVEQAERVNPFTVADPEILDPDLMREYANVPGGFVFAKPGSAGSLDKGFFRVQVAEMSPVLINFIDKYIGWCREITGIVPAIFGGDPGGGQQTAREAEMRRSQALQKLMAPWNQLRSFWAKTRENGIYQAAKYSGGQLFTSDPRGTVESINIEGIWELLQGGWFIECEESMPQTIGQRRDFVMGALNYSPEAQQMIGMNKAGNIVKIQEAIGMSDWDTPGYKAVIRLNDIIGRLLREQVQQQPLPPPDPMTGMQQPPPPPLPSIRFNSQLFDASLAIDVVKEWLLSDKGADAESNNPTGYENVMAFLSDVQQAMGPQGPQAPPPRMTINADIAELTPPAQHAVFQEQGFSIDPNVPIAMPKPQPRAALPPGDESSSRTALQETQPGVVQ